MSPPTFTSFAAGATGQWQIDSIAPVIGDSLKIAKYLRVAEDHNLGELPGAWTLRGTTSNARYAKRTELNALAERQAGLGRPHATRAALIPIRKTAAWWTLAQDERRDIMEERSHHIAIGMDYLPAVARRLHHCRDIGEPFDFLTWFEYAPDHGNAFEDMCAQLRQTEEWRYVDREVDVRLSRAIREPAGS